MFRAIGKKAHEVFKNEPGGHRWQRIPPNEKRGRRHTSTITVAVLHEPQEHEVKIDKRDLEESFTRGSGPGGQHRNKKDTCVLLKHKPSGIQIRVDGGRSQDASRQTAMSILRSRLYEAKKNMVTSKRNQKRQQQVGSGMRGDKIRTMQVHNDSVVDHRTGKRTTFKKFQKGDFSELR